MSNMSLLKKASRPPRHRRLLEFYGSVLTVLVILVATVGILWLLYRQFGLFDKEIGGLIDLGKSIEGGFQTRLVSGITIGSILIVLSFLLIPIFSGHINRKAFFTSIWRGLLSAATYLVASKIYDVALKKGHLALVITNIIFVFVTFVLIETIIILISDTDEKGLRTELTASIASGILFGILVQLFLSIVTFLQAKI